MSGVLDRLRKKRGFPVEIDGETYFVRSPTIGELKRLESLEANDKTGFLMGCALCVDAGGLPEFPKDDGETDPAWASRVLDSLSDVPTQTIRALSDGVAALNKAPKLEGVLKN